MTTERIIAGVSFQNPVITASGTYGFGREYNEFFPLAELGGISCKGTTLHARGGNPPPRIAETPSGILNSVGLQNPGIDHFIEVDLPWIAAQGTVVIANIAGSTVAEYLAACEKLNDTAVDMVELNISCPNVHEGGMSFGSSCASVESITAQVRKILRKPLMVKLTPNVTDIAEIAAAAESAGADAVSLINTISGMQIDIRTRRPVLRNNIGGLSGAAVLPVAVRMVWQTAKRVSIPIVGMGGVTRWQDALELMLAGATAIQIGTACFTDPYAPLKVAKGLEQYLVDNKLESFDDVVGRVEIWT